MAGRTRTEALTEEFHRQHIALSVAAFFVCTRLVSAPLRAYDVEHLNEMLELAGSALCKLAPLYAADSGGGARELTQLELEGARVRRGATRLVLRDGRTLSSVFIRREDLRSALAVLQALGIPQLVSSARKTVG
jgi:hypothetical protein